MGRRKTKGWFERPYLRISSVLLAISICYSLARVLADMSTIWLPFFFSACCCRAEGGAYQPAQRPREQGVERDSLSVHVCSHFTLARPCLCLGRHERNPAVSVSMFSAAELTGGAPANAETHKVGC